MHSALQNDDGIPLTPLKMGKFTLHLRALLFAIKICIVQSRKRTFASPNFCNGNILPYGDQVSIFATRTKVSTKQKFGSGHNPIVLNVHCGVSNARGGQCLRGLCCNADTRQPPKRSTKNIEMAISLPPCVRTQSLA